MDSDSDEDRQERDAFAERLKKRDEANKRNIASRSGSYPSVNIMFNSL